MAIAGGGSSGAPLAEARARWRAVEARGAALEAELLRAGTAGAGAVAGAVAAVARARGAGLGVYEAVFGPHGAYLPPAQWLARAGEAAAHTRALRARDMRPLGPWGDAAVAELAAVAALCRAQAALLAYDYLPAVAQLYAARQALAEWAVAGAAPERHPLYARLAGVAAHLVALATLFFRGLAQPPPQPGDSGIVGLAAAPPPGGSGGGGKAAAAAALPASLAASPLQFGPEEPLPRDYYLVALSWLQAVARVAHVAVILNAAGTAYRPEGYVAPEPGEAGDGAAGASFGGGLRSMPVLYTAPRDSKLPIAHHVAVLSLVHELEVRLVSVLAWPPSLTIPRRIVVHSRFCGPGRWRSSTNSTPSPLRQNPTAASGCGQYYRLSNLCCAAGVLRIVYSASANIGCPPRRARASRWLVCLLSAPRGRQSTPDGGGGLEDPADC